MLRFKAARAFWAAASVLALLFSLFTAPISAADSSAAKEKSSLFDSVVSLVSEKGASLVKDNLPTVGDFLCAQIFTHLGVDYTDSYTKEIKQVNQKLTEIQNSLIEILKDQKKQVSQNTILAFYNTVDVFSTTVYPLYASYSALTVREASHALTPEQARAAEAEFYNNNLKNILFGSSTSTGDLYLQLTTLLDKIALPNVTAGNLSLMDHYTVSYEHLWAFDSQSFGPKREFLEYVSATALEGLILYAFQNAYETGQASEIQKEVARNRWNRVRAAAEKAFAYLQKELQALEKLEKQRQDSGTILHYSTGKLLSRELYVAKAFPCGEKNHYTYATSLNTTRQGNIRAVEVLTLNCASFVDIIQKDFLQYKKNYNRETCTMAQFLQAAGFSCADWNHSLYRSQKMTHQGTTFTNEYYKFQVNYFSQNGLSANSVHWGQLQYKVFGSPTPRLGSEKNWSYIAFVGANGVLIGSYDTIYSDIGNTTVDAIFRMFSPRRSSLPTPLGKVR